MKKINYILLQAFLGVYVIELVYPPITSIFPSVYVVMGCMLGWLFVSFSAYPQYYLKCSRRLILILFCYIYASLMPRFAGNSMIGNRYMGMPMVFFGSVVYDFHRQTGTVKIIRNALIVAALFSILTAFTTIDALIENAYISRSIKSSGEHSENLAAMGIGGYSFIYYGAMLFPLLLHGLVNDRRTGYKVIFVLLLMLDLFLIMKSSYMTAIMIVLVTSIVYAVNSIMGNPNSRGFKLVLLLFSIVSLVLAMPAIMESVLPLLPPRIQQIFQNEETQYFTMSLYEEFIVDRWPQWNKSLAALESSPLLGIAVSGSLATSNGFLIGFGQHSFFLDTLALFGGVMGMMICVISTFPFFVDTSVPKFTRKQKSLQAAMLAGTLLMFLFNNVTDSIALASSLTFLYIRDHM